MSVLGAAEIEARKDEIFSHGTFSESCLRAAAYDLRVQIDPAGTHSPGLETGHSTVVLNKGQTVALESVELLSVPWELAANVGIKHRRAMRGLFISPGLFIDPGFGRSLNPPRADGCRLKFLATNMGEDPIELRLGRDGDHVVGIQFFRVEGPGPKKEVEVTNDSAKGLAIFGDIAEVKSLVREIDETARHTRTATDNVVVFGVFLVTAAIIGAIFTAFIAFAASGDAATNVVKAFNELDFSRPAAIAVLVCLIVLALGALTWLANQVVEFYGRIWRRKKTPASSG